MSSSNIEHAGVHYASHTLLETQRELNRELKKQEQTPALIKCDPMDLYPAAKPAPPAQAPAVVPKAPIQKLGISKGPVATSDYVSTLTSPVKDLTPLAPSEERVVRATDRLDELGNHPPADYTRRQMEPDLDDALGVLVPLSQRGSLALYEPEEEVMTTPPAIPKKTAEEFFADSLVKRGRPLTMRQYEALVEQLTKQRKDRELFESFEEIRRNALQDMWALQWEELYEFSGYCMQRAGEDMRARKSHEHWNSELDVRRKLLMEAIAVRHEEAIFHTAEILKELDMRPSLELYLEQLASFREFPELLEYFSQMAIEDVKTLS